MTKKQHIKDPGSAITHFYRNVNGNLCRNSIVD